jgi:hypothetical protein
VTRMHREAAEAGVIALPEVLAPQVALTAVLAAGTADDKLYVGQTLGPHSGDVMP